MDTPASPLLLQPLWDALIRVAGAATIGHPLFFIVPIMTTVVVAGLAFSCADAFVTKRLPFAPTVRYLAVTLPGYLVVFAVLQWLPMPLRFPVPVRAPTLLAFARDLVLCLIVGDVLSYWWHRLEHGSRLVFRRVHYVHHKVARPLTVWSGFYVHPVESLGVFITFYIYPFVFRVHPMVFVTYAALNTFITMVTHCGYDLWWYPKSVFASAPMHEHHHCGPKPPNFCVLLTLSDKLFGTFKPS